MSKNNRLSLIAIVCVAIGAMLTAWIVSYVEDWSRDWTTNVAETTVEAKDAHLRPLECTLSPQELGDAVLAAVTSLRRWTILDQPNPNGASDQELVLKLLHRTLLMQFEDDVIITIRRSGHGSVLNARSQSRIGKGDLGQNPRNLRQLLAAVRREIDGKKM